MLQNLLPYLTVTAAFCVLLAEVLYLRDWVMSDFSIRLLWKSEVGTITYM